MLFLLEYALPFAKSRSRGWVQIQCYPAGQQLENCWPTGEHCCRADTFESGKIRPQNWWPRVLKVRFCNFDYCFHSKTKMEPPKKRFTASKTINTPKGLLYVCISSLIIFLYLICFVLITVVYLFMLYNKRLNDCSPEKNLFCFPQISMNIKIIGNKKDVSRGSSH